MIVSSYNESSEVNGNPCTSLSQPSSEIEIHRVANIKEFRKPERLTCKSICTNILLDPVKCSKCSVHFCRSCLEKWLVNKKTCPNCRQEAIPEKPEMMLIDEIEDLLIDCQNKSSGCENPIKYDLLLKHEKECDFGIIKCKWCDFTGLKKDLKVHSEVCEERKVYCNGCLSEIHYKEMPTHYVPCLETAISLLRKKEKNSFKFSKNVYHRSEHIQLSGGKKAAMSVNVPSQSSTIFLKPRLKQKTKSSWKIKISCLKEWIGVGVSDFITLVGKSCKLMDSEIENRRNGCVMVSSNGIAWSHFNSSENYISFEEFDTGSIVQIDFDSVNNIITFHVNSKSKSMKLPATVIEWYPVVALGTTHDAVEII